MSGYLNNLVLRTLAQAPVVQPRLASVFETSVVMPPIKQASVSEEARSVASTEGITTPSDRVPQVHTSVQVLSPQSEEKPNAKRKVETVATDEVSKKEVPRVLPVAEVRAVKQQRDERVEQPTSGEQRTKIASVVDEARDVPPPQKAPVVREAARNESEFLWQKIESRVRQVVKDERPPSTAVNERSVKQAEAVQPRIAPQTMRPNSEPVAPPSSRSAVVATPPSFVPPAVPEITVTIGRVDVRAIISSAAQPVRREPARESLPSALDQYLKARSEGRR